MDALPGTGITLLVGPANSGKMGFVLNWWQERLDQKPVLVMPTGPDARALSAEMAQRVGGVIDQSGAVTFDGLVRLLLDRPPRYTSELERIMLVSRLLRETELDHLGRARHLPGTAAALADLLVELGESGKTAEEVDSVLARWAGVDPGASALAEDLRRLVAAYSAESVRLGWTERPAVLREAAAAAAERWTKPVAFYGFTSFTPGQRALMEALAAQAPLLVSLTHDRGRGIDLCLPEEVTWWEERAADVVPAAARADAYLSPGIAYLERHFMRDGPRPESPVEPVGREGVRFLLASGRRAEAELVALRIADLIRSGHRPGDIAVVVRQARAWRTLLGEVFDSCSIPYQMDDRCLLGETGLGQAFLRALRGVADDDAPSLLAFLRSPYSGVDPDDVSDLELQYLRGTARGGWALTQMARAECREALGPVWAMVRPATESAAPVAVPGNTAPDGAAPAAASAAASFDLAEAKRLTRRMLLAGIRGGEVPGRDVEEDARAYRALTTAFSTMRALVSTDEGFAALDPHDALRVLAQVSVPRALTDEGDAVQVLSVHRARARQFDVVLLLGLVEGEFPGRPDTPSLLSAAQRARLDALAGGLFTPEDDQEGALFASAVSRARRLLYLSARDAEDDGGEAAPSRFWESARTLLGAAPDVLETRTLADQVFAPHEAPSLRQYLRARATREPSHPLDATAAGPRVQPRPWRRPPARLTAPEVLDGLAAEKSYSPSALERYAACPFAWFIERLVKVEEVDLELDGRMIGELVHSALSATYQELAPAGLLPLKPDGVGRAEQIAFARVNALVAGDGCPGTPAERRLAAWKLRRMVRNLFELELQTASPMVVAETEAVVGDDGGVDIGGLRIHGRIDRVDVRPGGEELFVIDYKSGSAPALSAIGTEAGLQLPLYLLALGGERPDTQVVGGAYLSLSDKKWSGVITAGSEGLVGGQAKRCRVLDASEADGLFTTTRDAAIRAAAGMRAGDIAPKADRDCPAWCRLGPACRARRARYRP